MLLLNISLMAATLSTALVAGLLYAYVVSVNNGLGKLPDDLYIAAMQSINREIQNPFFFASFAGSLLLLPLATWFQYKAGVNDIFWLLLAASLIYAIGVFGITMFGNVRLNETLDAFGLRDASAVEIEKQRTLFEKPWIRLHNIRTVAAILSLVLVISACIFRSDRINM